MPPAAPLDPPAAAALDAPMPPAAPLDPPAPAGASTAGVVPLAPAPAPVPAPHEAGASPRARGGGRGGGRGRLGPSGVGRGRGRGAGGAGGVSAPGVSKPAPMTRLPPLFWTEPRRLEVATLAVEHLVRGGHETVRQLVHMQMGTRRTHALHAHCARGAHAPHITARALRTRCTCAAHAPLAPAQVKKAEWERIARLLAGRWGQPCLTWGSVSQQYNKKTDEAVKARLRRRVEPPTCAASSPTPHCVRAFSRIYTPHHHPHPHPP